MKIQKGIVKYKDRDDIVCTYGVTDSGKNYYFLENSDSKRLSNGNIIASTELVEAIDPMFKAKHIGVIDSSGKEVIPFVHRLIRPINDDILLVELSEPISENVKQANQMKSDSTMATKLVSTSALVKERLNSKMGSEGRYVFNDQFSDATVFDINGNNLINNEYFSFIGLAGGKLYFSKNTPDSDILEYSILPPEVQSNVSPVNASQDINVSEVNVSSDVVENALNNNGNIVENMASTEIPSQDIISKEEKTLQKEMIPADTTTQNIEDNSIVPSVGDVSQDIVNAPVEENSETVTSEDVPETDSVVAPSVDVPVEENTETVTSEDVPETDSVVAPSVDVPVEDNTETVISEDVPETDSVVAPSVDVPVEENTEIVTSEDVPKTEDSDIIPVVDTPVEENAEAIEEVTGGKLVNSKEEIETPFATEMKNDSLEETPDNEVDEEDSDDVDLDDKVEDFTLDDMFHVGEESEEDDNRFQDSIVQTDSILPTTDYESKYDDTYEDTTFTDTGDSIMSDVAKSMVALIKQNKELKASLAATQEKLDKAVTSRRNLADKSNMQEKKIDALNTKIRGLDSSLSKLEAKYQSLESKNRDQERVIHSQAHELEVLRPQLEGKEDLVKLLADAQLLLGEDNHYSYEQDSYLRKSA